MTLNYLMFWYELQVTTVPLHGRSVWSRVFWEAEPQFFQRGYYLADSSPSIHFVLDRIKVLVFWLRLVNIRQCGVHKWRCLWQRIGVRNTKMSPQ
jgi:hypothetical protein